MNRSARKKYASRRQDFFRSGVTQYFLDCPKKRNSYCWTEGRVIDTIINGLAAPLQTFPAEVAAIGMLGVQTLCNLFIPSGSGQAFVTMPIMAPLADLTSLTRQTAVLAYQFGDGFTNMIVPTNPVLMGILALGRIPYQRWARFIVPLLVKLYVVAVLALLAAVQIEY